MKWKRDASEFRTFSTHQFMAGSLGLDVGVTTPDGSPQSKRNWVTTGSGSRIDARSSIDISDSFGEMESIDIVMTIRPFDLPNLREFCPDQSLACVEFVCVVRCPRTRMRWLVKLEHDSSDDTWKGALSLQPGDLRGTVDVTPMVVSDSDNEPPFVTGTTVASGFAIQIRLDEAQVVAGSGLRINWQEFDPQHSDALFRLDIDEDAEDSIAVLYFNSRHPHLEPAIDYAGSRAPKAQVRDAIYAAVAPQVWLDLATWAGERLGSDDEDEATSASRVALTLERTCGVSRDDLLSLDSDEAARTKLSLSLQHWVGLATKQVALSSVLATEGSTDEEEA